MQHPVPAIRYYLEQSQSWVPRSDLKKQSAADTLAIMRSWFLANYCQPEDACPHDNESDDGYYYIWGGPYDPLEALTDEFGAAEIDQGLIRQVAREYSELSRHWSGAPGEDLTWGLPSELHLSTADSLSRRLDALRGLVFDRDRLDNHELLLKMAHIYSVTLLETFLMQKFVCQCEEDPESQVRLLQSRIFTKRRLQCGTDWTTLRRQLIGEILWHRLPEVIEELYQTTHRVQLPRMVSIYQAIKVRHHVGHRDGRDQNGMPIPLTEDSLARLLQDMRGYAESIEEAFRGRDAK